MAVKPKRASRKRRSPLHGLRARLDEAEGTLHAIRTGEVDALVVSGPAGEQTLSIEGAAHPYHVLLNAMSDGAALLSPDGTILFCNQRLQLIARESLEGLRGSRFQKLVAPAERTGFEKLLRKNGAGGNRAREFRLVGGDASATPAWISLSTVPLGTSPGSKGGGPRRSASVLMAIVTDLTERKRAEATRHGLMRRVISAEDDERRRIARELHDETGQSLTALLVGLRAIEEQALTLDVASTAKRLRSVAAETVDNVGRLARGLHPSVLDDVGLVAAARRHVSDFEATFGVAVELRLQGRVPGRMPRLAQTTLYRILQEALTNAARHAHARKVRVLLKHDGRTFELEVRDDGVGFEAGSVLTEASGLGLHGMQERVALLGGSVTIESRPGHGTAVRARIPTTMVGRAASRPARSRPQRAHPR